HVHFTSTGHAAGDAFERRANGEVRASVRVEVTGRERGAKPRARLVGTAEPVQIPELATQRGQARHRPVDDVNRSSSRKPADGFARYANREVGASIAIEIAHGHRGTKAVEVLR